MVAWLESVAKKANMVLQMEISERGASDASRIRYIRHGMLTASIGVPLRYMHSQVEVVDVRDIVQTVKFVKASSRNSRSASSNRFGTVENQEAADA